jgi:hypothetical protein
LAAVKASPPWAARQAAADRYPSSGPPKPCVCCSGTSTLERSGGVAAPHRRAGVNRCSAARSQSCALPSARSSRSRSAPSARCGASAIHDELTAMQSAVMINPDGHRRDGCHFRAQLDVVKVDSDLERAHARSAGAGSGVERVRCAVHLPQRFARASSCVEAAWRLSQTSPNLGSCSALSAEAARIRILPPWGLGFRPRHLLRGGDTRLS